MQNNLAEAIAPLLESLIQASSDHTELKLSISQSDAEISIAQEKVNTDQAEIDNLKNSKLSVSRNVLAGLSHNLKNSTEVLGYRKLDKEFKEYSLQITDSYYLGIIWTSHDFRTACHKNAEKRANFACWL